MPRPRRPDESYEDYRDAIKKENAQCKQQAKGKLVHQSVEYFENDEGKKMVRKRTFDPRRKLQRLDQMKQVNHAAKKVKDAPTD